MSPLKFFKRIAIGVISTGTTMMIAACYGVHHQVRTPRSSVVVVDAKGRGIRNIKICIKAKGHEECQPSRYQGRFHIKQLKNKNILYLAKNHGFTICARDIDGPVNGQFDQKCKSFPPNRISNHIEFIMD
jgi:hypothetical protein